MFDTENTALCSPAGRPICKILRRLAGSMRSAWMSTRMALSLATSRRNSSTELTALEMTVAVATPFTVIFSTMTKKRFSITFKMPEKASACSGMRVSPMLRKMAASKLYSRMTGIPIK